jgi:cell division septum initiation protein DivIVA
MAGASERLTEAVDRLILKYRAIEEENKRLSGKVDELENRVEYQKGNADSEGYNLLRIHYARLLHERQELKQRLETLLGKLEKLKLQQGHSADG